MLWSRRADGSGGGSSVIVFALTAAALGVAAIIYMVIALVKPEKF